MTIQDDRTRSSRRSRVGAADSSGRNRSAAAQRAIDRRRKRMATAARTGRSADRDLRPLTQRIPLPVGSPVQLARRIPFVVLVIGLLAVGLALTLWLSTTAAQNSYQLSAAKEQNQELRDKKGALARGYEQGESAPELAKKAAELGMIPATNVPRLVVGPDGKVKVVGEVKPAEGKPAPSMEPGNSGAVNPGVNPPNSATSPAGATTPDPNLNTQNPVVPPNFNNVLPPAASPTPNQGAQPTPSGSQNGGTPTSNSPTNR